MAVAAASRSASEFAVVVWYSAHSMAAVACLSRVRVRTRVRLGSIVDAGAGLWTGPLARSGREDALHGPLLPSPASGSCVGVPGLSVRALAQSVQGFFCSSRWRSLSLRPRSVSSAAGLCRPISLRLVAARLR